VPSAYGGAVAVDPRPFFEAARVGWAQAAGEDPCTIHRYGQLATTAFGGEVASDLFSLGGASAADERHDLSRHWRNARTHGRHGPVAWKYHHVGNDLLNGARPPDHGQIGS
jgi:alkylation response protein AidB-like acyl-CoA dehydrogenase